MISGKYLISKNFQFLDHPILKMVTVTTKYKKIHVNYFRCTHKLTTFGFSLYRPSIEWLYNNHLWRRSERNRSTLGITPGKSIVKSLRRNWETCFPKESQDFGNCVRNISRSPKKKSQQELRQNLREKSLWKIVDKTRHSLGATSSLQVEIPVKTLGQISRKLLD